MSSKTLELRQKDAMKVNKNGDYEVSLPYNNDLTLEDGDTLQLQKVFIDTEADSSQKINIPELDLWKSENAGGLSIDANIRKNLNEKSEKGLNFKNFEKKNKYNVQQITLDSLEFSFGINFIKV